MFDPLICAELIIANSNKVIHLTDITDYKAYL